MVDSKFILSDYPQFYPSNTVNFNEILQDTLASMSKTIYQVINPVSKKTFNEFVILGNTLRSFEYFSSKSPDEIKYEFENKWLNPQNWDDFKINIGGNYEIIQIRTGKYGNNFTNRLKKLLFGFFAEMTQINSDEYSSRIRYLHEVYLFTAKLIRQNSLIPEFFKLDNSK